MDNRNNTPIPAAALEKVIAKLDEARAELAEVLLTLTPKQRQEIPKMGDKSVAFVAKAAELARANPKLMPEYVNVADLELDANTVAALLPVLQRLKALAYDVESTRMVAASEGYVTALLAYGAFQAAARAGQPAAQTAVEQLKPRFAGQKKGGEANKGKKAASTPA